jgi:hypothetical protein
MGEAKSFQRSIVFEARAAPACTTASSSRDTDDQWIEQLGTPSQTTVIHKSAWYPEQPTCFYQGRSSESQGCAEKSPSLVMLGQGTLPLPHFSNVELLGVEQQRPCEQKF